MCANVNRPESECVPNVNSNGPNVNIPECDSFVAAPNVDKSKNPRNPNVRECESEMVKS